jgi:hypothetical protein
MMVLFPLTASYEFDLDQIYPVLGTKRMTNIRLRFSQTVSVKNIIRELNRRLHYRTSC